jgi:hypothetical protein
MHATLAGIPEPLWRPLSRVGSGTRESQRDEYRVAVAHLESALAKTPVPGFTSPD